MDHDTAQGGREARRQTVEPQRIGRGGGDRRQGEGVERRLVAEEVPIGELTREHETGLLDVDALVECVFEVPEQGPREQHEAQEQKPAGAPRLGESRTGREARDAN